MPDPISPDSVPQVPGATASNPFPKMTREEQVHFVVKGKRKFPKKTFAAFLIVVILAAAISYILYRNQKSQFVKINDAGSPEISINSPQNGDTLKGQSQVVVYVADNTITHKAYKATISPDLKVTSSQPQTVTVNIPDDLKKATSAQLLYETTGVTDKNVCQVALAGTNPQNCGPTYSSDQDAQKQTYNADVSKLKTGDNAFQFTAAANSTLSIKSAQLVVISGDPAQTGKVVKVEFLLDNKVVGQMTDFTLPFTLDTTKFSNGAHVLVAKAYNEVGTTSLSAPRAITIQN